MKSTHYDQATIAYNAQNYPQALKGYYQCLKEDWNTFESGDAGLIYHRIGNCLIKMKNFKEAAASYQKALQDESYNEKTSIHVNLATTLNSIGKYTEAIEYFDKALADKSYSTPYRAYMGLGSSYTKLGKYVDAGTAYRSAALDEGNPNPVKALMCLGSTFSKLGRPEDAVEAYLAILDFRVTGNTLNTTYERLGQAFVAAGNYRDAVSTFEEVLSNERFTLSNEAREDYQKARLALGLEVPHSYDSSLETGDETGYDGGYGVDPYANDGFLPETSIQYPVMNFNEEEGYGAGNVPNPGDTGFFTATDEELFETGRRQLRKERKLRHIGLKVFLGIVIVLIIALGVCVLAYTRGVGIPSQETVVTNFFTAMEQGDSIDEYWFTDSDEDKATLERLLDGVAKSSDVTVVSIDSTMTESQVLADVKLPEGGVVHYRIDLTRDLIGWKMTGITLVFASSM